MQKITDYFKNYVPSIKITTSKNIDLLNKLIDGENVSDRDIDNPELAHFCAVYYEINYNLILAIRYYLLAIENANVESMHMLAELYRKQKNYDLAERYHLAAIEHKHVGSMYRLSTLVRKNKRKFG